MGFAGEYCNGGVSILLALLMALSVIAGSAAAGVGGERTGAAHVDSMTQATSVSSCTTISSSGRYVLDSDITDSTTTPCIRITANDVVLDGAGHTVDGVDGADTRGVYVFESAGVGEGITTENVTITNLTVTDWAKGIEFSRVDGGTVHNVRASSNEIGVRFTALSKNHEVRDSVIEDNNDGLQLGGDGGATVEGNRVENNSRRGILIGSLADQIDVVDNRFVDNERGVRVGGANGTEVRNNSFDGFRATGVVLRGGAPNATVAENEFSGSSDALAAVWTYGGDHVVRSNVIDGDSDAGIAVARGGALIVDNRIENVDDGLAAYSAQNATFRDNEISNTERAIYTEDGARNNRFQGDTVEDSTWAFYAVANATASVENLTLGTATNPATVSFEARDAAVRSVASPPTAPPSVTALDRHVYTNATSPRAYLNLSMRYTDGDVRQAGVNESRLRLWRHRGGWTPVAGPNAADPARNVVSANLTSFGVVAPMSHSPETVSRIAFDYGDYGGNLNIEVNGDFRKIDRFSSINGTTIGGTSITVTNRSVPGGERGTVAIAGSISSFSLGGQELWIDDVAFGPATRPRAIVRFSNLTPPQPEYQVGDTFTSSPSNVSMAVESFTFANGTSYSQGEGRPATNSPPLSGGSGQDFNTDNVNLRFDVGGIVNGTANTPQPTPTPIGIGGVRTPPGIAQPGFGAVVALVAFLVAALVAARRRS